MILLIIMKTLLLTLTFLVAVCTGLPETEDENIKKLSNFLIQLISKYDTNGAGFIKRQDYPLFLQEVFVKGSNLTDEDKELTDLLLKAGKQFTGGKDQEKKQIGVQQFYDDIISGFTVFLMEKDEYSLIIDKLFDDIKEEKVEEKAEVTEDL